MRRAEASRRVGLAYDHLIRREWDEAARESREAASFDPGHPQAWANLGIALFKTGDVVGARDALERSLALDPKNDRLRALLARPELQR
jgi:Flp pilus assembly protein TadD